MRVQFGALKISTFEHAFETVREQGRTLRLKDRLSGETFEVGSFMVVKDQPPQYVFSPQTPADLDEYYRNPDFQPASYLDGLSRRYRTQYLPGENADRPTDFVIDELDLAEPGLDMLI